jgi:transposase
MNLPLKPTVQQKEQIVIETFTASNNADLCKMHDISVSQFHRWKQRILEGGREGLGESSKGNEYKKKIYYLKKLLDGNAPAIDALKKSRWGRK